jgi:SpoVK/Ycf46/Vps4 family AAA+-type ATPase
MTTLDNLIIYLRASYPGIALETHEEARALADVAAAAKATDKDLGLWSATTGLQYVGKSSAAVPESDDLYKALTQMRKPDTVYCLRDAHTWPWERDPLLGRALRDALHALPQTSSTLVFIGAQGRFHATSEKLVTVLPYDLPGESEFRRLAESIMPADEVSEQLTDVVLAALSGLGLMEAENALARSLAEIGRLDPSVLYREKVQAVRRSGLLDIITPDPRGLDAIGGLELLKRWILRRVRHFSREARAYGLAMPKGVLIAGVQGTGKSLAANAIATTLGIPMLALDWGKLFGSLVGESEEKTRTVLATAVAMAPCVLRIDEIDKGASGTSARGADSDGGVGRRMLGTMLTWMQEKRAPVFIVATANDVTALDPALLRKGRFDEIFAVDLPTLVERMAILDVQIRARSRKPKSYDLARIARAAEGFTGAEIEAAINEGMTIAFDDDEREFETKDVLAGVESIVPLSRTARETVEAIREWGRTRARPASIADEPTISGRKLAKQSLN